VKHGDDLLAILRDVLLTVRLDNHERFRQIVLEEKASQEAGLVPGGHIVTLTRLRAFFNEADWAAEQIGGVSYLLFLRQLAADMEDNWPAVLAKLETIRRLLAKRSAMICNVTLDRANWGQLEPKLRRFLNELPADQATLNGWKPVYAGANEGLAIPAQVNYVGKGANLYRLGYQLHGSIRVVTNYLETTWLWDRVRVHGGAYGGFCLFDHRSGVFGYISYRDPNLLATLDNYDGASQFLRELELSGDELVKGIIGAINLMDAYQLPDAKGYTSMLRSLAGDTDESRQQMRDEVLSTTLDDFRNFAEVLDLFNANGRVAVLGPQAALEEAGDGLGLRTIKVL
jgi:Zn-dependent M16 (insulinase) family peptidase